MTQHRRNILRTAGLLIIPAALIMAGCSAGGGNDNAGGDAKSFSYAFSTSGNASGATVPWQEQMAKKYMKEHPDIKITLNPLPNDKYGDTIRTQLQAGNASDVIETAPGAGQTRSMLPLAKAGFLEPLGDYATKLIPEGQDALFQMNGKTYGMAKDFGVISAIGGLGTAKDKFGISEWPEDTSTLTEDCKIATDKGGSFFVLAGAAGPNVGLAGMVISATRVYAEDPDWNQQREDKKVTFAGSEGWKDTLQTFLDLKKAGCYQPGAEGGGFDVLSNGLQQQKAVSGFIPSGVALSMSQLVPSGDFRVLAFPPADGGKPFVLASSDYALSINAASKAKSAAVDFVKWMGAPENADAFFKASGLLPAGTYKNMDLKDTIYAPVLPLLNDGSYVPLPSNEWPNLRVYDVFQSGMQGLLTGQKTVDQVLKDMDNAWDS